MRNFILFFFTIILSITQAAAGELKEIQLNDGSILFGEIISMNNDIYIVKSRSLGNIEINNSKIYAINPMEISKEQYQELQQKMLDDKDIMAIILSLQNDPDVIDVLNNQDLMAEINAGNIANLSSNPTFIKLLSNPKFQEIWRMIIKQH
ncbi:MAG: hypothetical protein JW882_07665 [Deltaproteobacteria bacterium]|nr:hypothetical protein [Deltaproteobacteria bacterium]